MALSKLCRNRQKIVVEYFVTNISFCQRSDDLSFHENCDISLAVYMWGSYSPGLFCPILSKKIYLNLLQSKTRMCWTTIYKYSSNRSMKILGQPFLLCWVTHHKTNYGVGKLKSLWGGPGKNGNILSTPKEIPINIPSHIIPRSSAPGRHHIILLANHQPATLFLES